MYAQCAMFCVNKGKLCVCLCSQKETLEGCASNEQLQKQQAEGKWLVSTGQMRDGQEGNFTICFSLNHVNMLPVESEFKNGNKNIGNGHLN